jgi:hypothetical protein
VHVIHETANVFRVAFLTRAWEANNYFLEF